MEDNNNNMEEFFKRSLEQFDEAPSNDVWTNISDRLIIEAKWYDPILTFIKSALPFIIAALLVGSYHFYAQNKLSTYKKEISQAKTTIQQLENEKTEYLTQINGIEELKTEFLDNINEKKLTIEELSKENKSLTSKTNQLLRKLKSNTNSANTLVLNDLRNKILILEERLQIKEAEVLALQSKAESEKPSPSKRNKEVFCSTFRHLPGVRSNKISEQNGLTTWTRPAYLKNEFSEEIEEEETILKGNRLRLGLKLRYFNTLVKNSQLINPGFSRGIRTEYSLNNKWAITSDLLYNQQAYAIAPNTGTISTETLERFPGGLEDNTNVSGVNTKSRYFDASLGFKFSPDYQIDKFNFFINPSVVWKLYLPQEFQFNLLQESNVSYTSQTYTAYFGSGNLSLGFEKRISPKLLLQVSLWGEQSFIPLGHEKQYVSMFGVSSSILF